MTSASVTAWRLGSQYPEMILRGGLVIGIAAVLGLTILTPWAVPFIPIVLIGMIVGGWLFTRPRLNLFAVLASYVLVASFDEGIDPIEIAYALFYAGYLGQWFFRRVVLSTEPLVRTGVDVLVLAFLATITLYSGIGLVFGGEIPAIVAEVQSWTLLAFYFPVKEAVERTEDGLKWLIVVLAWLGLFVVVRNAYELAQRLLDVTQAWQITIKGRVVTNEMLMVVPAFLMLCAALVQERRSMRIRAFAVFMILLFGIIVTQGRGYWLGFAFGLFLLFLAVEQRMRIAMLWWGVLGLSGTAAAIFLLFGEHALLLSTGLINRVLSIGSATTRDISLIGRFIEWKSVLADIQINPILGYGSGVSISYFDITRSVTMTRPWIHNGYLAIWFKYGIIGLGLVLSFTLVSIRNAFRAARSDRADQLTRIGAYAAFAGLSSVLISTIPSNAWHNSDTILMIAIMMGIAGGCYSRTRR
jgi:O-antigen ligase